MLQNFDRYQRQMIFPGIGEVGQQRLLAATAVVVGCGATGSVLAMLLARAGVGRLRIIDRDFVELTNLQRQVLFSEEDVAQALPKAEAAARALRRINGAIAIEGVVADVNPGNVIALLADATVVLDGTDNFTTRYLLNDACLKLGKPWVYTGVIASWGMTATFVPDGAAGAVGPAGVRSATGCLRCLLGDMPAPGTTPGCDTAGVLGPAVSLISSVGAGEAMKLIMHTGDLNPGLLHMDLWTHEYEALGALPRDPACPACAAQRYDFLDARSGALATSLCGRNAVQVVMRGAPPLDLAQVERQLAPVAQGGANALLRNAYLLRAQVDGYEFTIFPDNRAIIKGTDDVEVARSLYARYVGG